MAQFIKLAILHLMLWHTQSKVDDADRYAYYINYYSEEFNMDPVIPTAVIFRESSFNPKLVGHAGELGLGQLKRHTPSTKGYDNLARRALFEPSLNIYLTVRNLARVRDYCNSDNPNIWLSAYNGFRRKNGHCYKTAYSVRVMQTYRTIKRGWRI